MGARISKEPLESPKPFPLPPPPPKGQPWPKPVDDPCDIQTISQSRFYSLVQQAVVWPEYFAIYDQREATLYNKDHLVQANASYKKGDDLDWAWEMLVLIYSAKDNDATINEFVEDLKSAENPPRSIYVLEGPYKKFIKRFPVCSYRSPLAESLPGPVELVPPTPKFPATYAIHRVHFLRAKEIIARLWCSTIINVSSRRLFVKTKGIVLENTTFEDDPKPTDFVVTAYMKYAAMKPKKKGKNNIIVIDESGCDYATVLGGWHLIKHRQCTTEQAIESMSQRSGFLDTWYTELIAKWAEEFK